MCPCGAEMKETFASFYSVANYNDKGELILAICHHGRIVVDKQKNYKMKFNLTKRKM